LRDLAAAATLAAAALPLAACVEAEVQTEIRADGSGSFSSTWKCSEKVAEMLHRVRELDPSKAGELDRSISRPRLPPGTVLRELEAAGLRVLECDSANGEKDVSFRMRLDFRDLAALQRADRLETNEEWLRAKGGAGSNLWLTRDADGRYEILFYAASPGSEVDRRKAALRDDPSTPPKKDGEPGAREPASPEDAETARRKRQEAIRMMGDLMGEAAKLRFVVGLRVPGEVVDHSPKSAAKVEDGKVTWTLDHVTLLRLQLEGAGARGDERRLPFRVGFRMPEGKSLPESALRAPPAPEPKREPASPTPGGGK